jgi:hypothetical protein
MIIVAPSIEHLPRALEGELQSEIQLPHRCVWCEAGDQSRTSTVDAIVWVIEIHMIEHIESFKPELRSETFRDGKVLEERHIGIEEARAGECVSPAAKRSCLRALKDAFGHSWSRKVGYRSVEGNTPGNRVEVPNRRTEMSNQDRPADAYILVLTAVVVAGAPR